MCRFKSFSSNPSNTNTSFNTSYVSVQVNTNIAKKTIYGGFNTSYVSVQDAKGWDKIIANGFQYILCVGSSHLNNSI